MKLIDFKGLMGIVAVSGVALTGPVVRAAGAEQPSTRDDQTEPRPPPGTSRLISIGPQALVVEDDQGNLTMADEPDAKPSKLQVAGIMLGAMTAGVVVVFYGDAGRSDRR